MSDKSVAERLQVKNDRRLAVIGATAAADASVGAHDRRAELADADVVLLFVRDRAELQAAFTTVGALRPAAIPWLAYPKLTSTLAGELNRDLIRESALGTGLDTVSQISVDETWSALRLKRADPASPSAA